MKHLMKKSVHSSSILLTAFIHKNLFPINQAYSGMYCENIRPHSFLHRHCCARSVLPRPQADILPVQPKHSKNPPPPLPQISDENKILPKIYLAFQIFSEHCILIYIFFILLRWIGPYKDEYTDLGYPNIPTPLPVKVVTY